MEITTFPTIQDASITLDGTFQPQANVGIGKQEFRGDVYSSRGFFGNGDNHWIIGASEMRTNNYVAGNSGCLIGYDGDVEFNTGIFRGTITTANVILTGGTIRFQKTNFNDSSVAGYYIGSEGIYFGSVADASKLKYTISTGIFDFIGSHSGGTVGGIAIANITNLGTANADSVPSGLSITTTGINTANDGTQSAYVTLSWTAIATDTFDHYLIRYKKHAYTYYQYLEVRTNNLTIDNLIPNVSYDFGIASVNKYGTQSAFSADVNQTTASDTAAPATVSAGSATAGIQYVILEWTHNTEADLASYNIYRSETNNSASAVLIGNCRTNYFVDGGRTGGTTYFYWVKAVDTSGNVSVAFSTVKSATPRNVTSDDIVTIAGSKVLIDGAVYLSNWRHTSDLTKIDGGDIYAQSVTTTQLNFTPVQTTDVIAKINASLEGITIEADNLTINAATTFGAGYNPTTKVASVGGVYDSAASGARVRIFPDANTGIQVIDDGANDVFKCIVGGTNVGDVQIGNYAAGQGALYDKSAALFNFKGTIAAGSVFVGTDASLLEMAAQSDFPPDTNLVTYWPCDEGQGTIANDGSGHNNPLTLEGATWATGGPAGGWIDFDGVTNRATWVNPLLGKTAFTIAFPFYKDAYVQYAAVIADYRNIDGYRNLLIGYENPDGTFMFYMGDGTNTESITITGVTVGLHHIICRFDAANNLLAVFLDGVKTSKATTLTQMGATSYPGGEYTSVGRYATNYEFNGKMGPIKFYDAALTDAQCYALYKNPGQGKSLSVPVGRVVSGSIYSRQIILVVTPGLGDSYIAGGNSLDWTNWRGGDGSVGAVMLGLDDSDTDKAKFFVGDFSSHKYYQFDGADHIMTGVMVNRYFGDGRDETVTFDGSTAVAGATRSGSTYTLTRNVYYYDATVDNGVTVITAGYRIFCLGTLTNNGIIHNNGSDGGNGAGSGVAFNTGGAGGAGGLGAATGSFTRMAAGPAGGKGGDGGTTAGSDHKGQNGGTGTGQTYSFDDSNGQAGGGDGGDGASGASYAGGTLGAGGVLGTQEYPVIKFREITIVGSTDYLDETVQKIVHGSQSGEEGSANCGAGGGAGGGGNSSYYGASGGGGGGTAGTVYIAARKLAGNGYINAIGGKGGAGASSTNAGASGQGSGGNGGIIFLIYESGPIGNFSVDGGGLNSPGEVENYAWYGRDDYRPQSNTAHSDTHTGGGGYNGHNGKLFAIKVNANA